MVALFSDGTARCWGLDRGGLCTYPVLDDGYLFRPTHVEGLSCAADVAFDITTAVARLADGRVAAWGANDWGQVLGYDPALRAVTPVPFDLGYDVNKLDCTSQVIYVTNPAGDLSWWGMLHVFPGLDSATPTSMPGLAHSVTSVSASAHTCVVTSAGTVSCWGPNEYGELGDGTFVDRDVAAPAIGIAESVADVRVGSRTSCALTISGAVYCWGRNWGGELGQGWIPKPDDPEARSAIPLKVQLDVALSKLIFSDGSHTVCGLAAGDAICWGANFLGAVQQGKDPIPTPTRLSEPHHIVDMAVTSGNACFLLEDRTVWCRGGGVARGEGSTINKDLLVQVDFSATEGTPPASHCLPR